MGWIQRRLINKEETLVKHISTRCFFGLLIDLVVGISANNQLAGAVVLTFDFDVNFTEDYGDGVNTLTFGVDGWYGAAGGFTPNVTVDYLGSMGDWPSGYGSLNNVIYESDNDGVMNVKFEAESGYLVALDSFVLAGFSADYEIDAVQVLDGDNLALYSLADPTISGLSYTSFNFASPLVSQVLTIRIDASNLGFESDHIGLDNVQFSQITVPEPASFLLAISGGLCFISLRRWRRRGAP
jgi:hypothetical protein